jgi:hypothetical protein
MSGTTAQYLLGAPKKEAHKFLNLWAVADALELTPETIRELVCNGWKEADLTEAADNGARYSPQRNSLIFPVFTDVDGM